MRLANVFSSIAIPNDGIDNVSFIKSQLDGTATWYETFGWFGALADVAAGAALEPGKGFQLLMNNPAVLFNPDGGNAASSDADINIEDDLERSNIQDLLGWNFNPREYEFNGAIHFAVDNFDDRAPTDNESNTAPQPLFDLFSPATTEDKIITIESDLFIARLSSAAGGSVVSYKIKDHLSPDSSLVDLGTPENRNNLLISFRGIDGEIINLRDGWTQNVTIDSAYLFEPKTITYTNQLDKKPITKTITLYPDNFIIDI